MPNCRRLLIHGLTQWLLRWPLLLLTLLARNWCSVKLMRSCWCSWTASWYSLRSLSGSSISRLIIWTSVHHWVWISMTGPTLTPTFIPSHITRSARSVVVKLSVGSRWKVGDTRYSVGRERWTFKFDVSRRSSNGCVARVADRLATFQRPPIDPLRPQNVWADTPTVVGNFVHAQNSEFS